MQSVEHLDDSTVAALLGADPPTATTAVWNAFAAWGRGTASTTQRVRASTTGGGTATAGATGRAGMFSAMAAVVPPYCGGKVYATAGGRFSFVNVLFHVDGRVLATLDGDAITGFRTAAASALAIHHLATPDTTTATIVGTGRQSWPHLEMLAATLPALADVRICGRPGTSGTAQLADRASTELGLSTTAHDSPADAIDGAQVVVAITNASSPLFPASAVADDALICAVGATKYDRVEIGADVVARCGTVVCDDVVGSRAECGDLIAAAAAGVFDWSQAIELHAIAAGTVTPPRAGRSGPVLFETQGVALQDVALCGLADDLFRRTATDRGVPTPC